jgi:hypothetical protein
MWSLDQASVEVRKGRIGRLNNRCQNTVKTEGINSNVVEHRRVTAVHNLLCIS